MTLRDRPSLAFVVEALMHASQLDAVVIATSTDPTDDQTVQFAEQHGLACHRGSLDDVALRLLRAGEDHDADAIVRINGDSPLMDPAIVDHAVELFRERSVDIVTNVRPRAFPKGQSVEVLGLGALRSAVARMTLPNEREHVTPHLYAHPEAYSVHSFATDHPRPDVQLSIDDMTDFARVEAILSVLPGPPWQAGWRACVAAYDQYMAQPPELRPGGFA